MTEINHLQKLQNRAARIVTGSSFDSPGRPLIKKFGWKTLDELIASESNIMFFNRDGTREKCWGDKNCQSARSERSEQNFYGPHLSDWLKM